MSSPAPGPLGDAQPPAGSAATFNSSSPTEYSDVSSFEDYSHGYDPWNERPPYVANAAAEQFVAANKTHWTHSPQAPHTLFKLKRSSGLDTSLKYHEIANTFFRPMAVMDAVDHQSRVSAPIEPAAFGMPQTHDLEEMLYPSTTPSQMFSGYCYIPRMAFNTSSEPEDSDSDMSERISQLAYHNYHSQHDVNYAFGGLAASKAFDFSAYGLPSDIDPAQVSVQLAAELPPFVDRNILTSPYVQPNPHIYVVNPNRNTTALLDRFTSTVPSSMCSMSSTRISHRHVFFFGGFELRTDSVVYDKELDRWLVSKSIHLNHDGYIFDTETIRFTKVKLVPDSDFHVGRLGSAITSNQFLQLTGGDNNILREPTPAQYMDPNYFSPLVPATGTVSPRKSPSIKSKASAGKGAAKVKSRSDSSGSFASPKSRESPVSLPNRTISFKETSKKDRKGQLSSPSSPQLLHRQPSPLTESPHLSPLSGTYFNKVRSERSNSGVSSRPISPVPSYVPPISISGKMDDEAVDECYCTDEMRPCKHCLETFKEEANDPHKLYREMELAPTDSLTSIYVFGGFVAETVDDVLVFKPSDDMLRIDLTCKGRFFASNMDLEPPIYKLNPAMLRRDGRPSDVWPSPRGYFASTLIEYEVGLEEECEWNNIPSSSSNSNLVFDEDTVSSNSIQTSMRSSHRTIRTKTPQEFFKKKALLVQGGCDGKQVFSDLHIFKFDSGEWESISTFAYDYFGKKYEPDDDGFVKDFADEKELKNPEVMEAELRACHHQALYYNKQGREYVFFVGGLSNDYLRHFDETPYKSDKLDVSRMAKIRIIAEDRNTCRILVLNVKTQTWSFFRYYFDFRKITSQGIFDKLSSNPQFLNSSVTQFGGSVSLCGKMITMGHGLCVPISERKADFAGLDAEFPGTSMFWGVHMQFLFPFL